MSCRPPGDFLNCEEEHSALTSVSFQGPRAKTQRARGAAGGWSAGSRIRQAQASAGAGKLAALAAPAGAHQRPQLPHEICSQTPSRTLVSVPRDPAHQREADVELQWPRPADPPGAAQRYAHEVAGMHLAALALRRLRAAAAAAGAAAERRQAVLQRGLEELGAVIASAGVRLCR